MGYSLWCHNESDMTEHAHSGMITQDSETEKSMAVASGEEN